MKQQRAGTHTARPFFQGGGLTKGRGVNLELDELRHMHHR
jgi:hypothetical protein